MPRRSPDESAPSPRPRRKRRQVVGLLGLALDGEDGETRITKGDEFVLFGGSSETHERMQDLAVHVTERLAKDGKRISDASLRELRRIVRELD
jgi:hypothetical protein